METDKANLARVSNSTASPGGGDSLRALQEHIGNHLLKVSDKDVLALEKGDREARALLKTLAQSRSLSEAIEQLKAAPPSAEAIFLLPLVALDVHETESSIRMAEKRHGLKGGSREKRLAIREIWKSGKYSSRDICAEQECAALGMSFSTARKALRGTDDPI